MNYKMSLIDADIIKFVRKVVFTAEQHLGVQEQIESRARELWCMGAGCHGTALSHWLQAEREVLEQFIRAYAGDAHCRNLRVENSRLESQEANLRPES
jgi:hypothetical protein